MFTKIENGIVIQTDVNPRDGFIWIEGAVCGMIYDSETGELSIPSKTYDDELVGLNSEFNSKMRILVEEYNIAVARDGSNETAKVEAARAKITDLDVWYSSESEALLIKHFF